MAGPAIPNLTQLVSLDGVMAGLDTQGNIWLIQIHPHAQFNPINKSDPTWTPRLYYVKPIVDMGSTGA